MRSIINRHGSKAATRAIKRFGTGLPNRTRPSASKSVNPETPTNVRICATCANIGWETMDKVAACNCCENGAFYAPVKPQQSNLEQGD